MCLRRRPGPAVAAPAALLLLLLAAPLGAQDPSVAQLIERLHSDSVEEREAASKELQQRGAAVRPDLERAARSGDGEVVERVRALLGLLDAREAKEDQKRLETTLSSARTLKIDFSAAGPKLDLQGSLCIAEGNRIYCCTTVHEKSKRSEERFWSDGEFLVRKRDGGQEAWEARRMPPTLAADLALAFARGGCTCALVELVHVIEEANDGLRPDLPSALRLTAFSRLATEGSVRSLRCKIEYSRFLDLTGSTRLWYDPDSWRPTRRTIDLRKNGDDDALDLDETYSAFAINAPIPEATFVLPEGSTTQFRIPITQETLARIREALQRYREDVGALPSTETGLGGLRKAPAGGAAWKGPYLPATLLLKDGWKNSFIYRNPGRLDPKGYDLFSPGPDGKPDTLDDIGS